MKIYLTNINESWIIDRIRNERISNNKKITTKYSYLSQIIWDVAPWTTKPSFLKKFKNKKIIQSVYHIEDTSSQSKEVEKITKNDKFINFFRYFFFYIHIIFELCFNKYHVIYVHFPTHSLPPILFFPFLFEEKAR